MSSYRTNLLKLIDLAIGFPNPGSVNFNLLHKILYVLALRDAAGGLCLPMTETDEIELSRSNTLANQKLLEEALKDGSKTRLTVQRVMNRSDNDGCSDSCNATCIRIAGSRIVMPSRGTSQHSIGQPERLESQMSAISTMVSDLEERLEQISVKPSNACEKGLNELRKRIEGLEKAVEVPILKQTMDGPLSFASSELQAEMEKMWDAIRTLTEKMNTISHMDTGNLVETDKIAEKDRTIEHDFDEPQRIDIDSSTNNNEAINMESTAANVTEAITSIESKLHKLELQLQSLIEEMKSANIQVDLSADENEAPMSPRIADKLALIEQMFGTRIEQIEHSIKRLFQEKADDVAIESRIRNSVRFSNRSSLIPLDELPYQRRDDHNDGLSMVKEQLKATQNELLALRETVQTMANQNGLASTINTNSEKIRQLHLQFETFKKSHPTEPERAAGTKLNPIMNSRCISCNRAVAMDRCDEIIPKPPLLSVSRVVKPSLRRQLHEMHIGMDSHGTGDEFPHSMGHLEKIYHSIEKAKTKQGK